MKDGGVPLPLDGLVEECAEEDEQKHVEDAQYYTLLRVNPHHYSESVTSTTFVKDDIQYRLRYFGHLCVSFCPC